MRPRARIPSTTAASRACHEQHCPRPDTGSRDSFKDSLVPRHFPGQGPDHAPEKITRRLPSYRTSRHSPASRPIACAPLPGLLVVIDRWYQLATATRPGLNRSLPRLVLTSGFGSGSMYQGGCCWLSTT